MENEPAVRAVEFESRTIYQSCQHPSYTSWVSFFPGESGQWYLSCEEVTRPEAPLPRSTSQQWFRLVMPVGFELYCICFQDEPLAVVCEGEDARL
ncbi:MAG: hypothetical protein HY709_03960 [Candidatus Latescibacteria bacterium]|nr:hypothetical protein [Candidatus Latescibacterota bacterium]